MPRRPPPQPARGQSPIPLASPGVPVEGEKGRRKRHAPSLEHILLGDGCNVEDLGRVKEWAKTARNDAESGLPSAVCHVLYYAAIAAASVRCGRRLTSLPRADLKQGFIWALAQAWVPESIRQLLAAMVVAIDKEN
ncbi:MAG TPA: hypothetical protein VIM11_18045 [Tepidisphaeraceae bacterium]